MDPGIPLIIKVSPGTYPDPEYNGEILAELIVPVTSTVTFKVAPSPDPPELQTGMS